MIFKDRFQAAKMLVRNLQKYKNCKDTIVLALPKGGIPLGDVISKELNLPFSIFFVNKITSPFNKEVTIGSICESKYIFKNYNLIDVLGIPSNYIETTTEELLENIKEKKKLYSIKPINLKRKRVILVDDGVATGSSVLLAIVALKKAEYVKEVIVASPIASADGIKLIKSMADGVEVLLTPKNFTTVSAYYQRFHHLSDNEVIKYLNR